MESLDRHLGKKKFFPIMSIYEIGGFLLLLLLLFLNGGCSLL